jgi:hypothetical protein
VLEKHTGRRPPTREGFASLAATNPQRRQNLRGEGPWTGIPNVVRRCALSGLRRHRQYEQVAGGSSPPLSPEQSGGGSQRSCLAWCAGGGSSSAPGTSHARSASQEYSSSGFLSLALNAVASPDGGDGRIWAYADSRNTRRSTGTRGVEQSVRSRGRERWKIHAISRRS